MTYEELYYKLEKQYIDPLRDKYESFEDFDAWHNMRHQRPCELFEIVKEYETMNNSRMILVSWQDEVELYQIEFIIKEFLSIVEELKEV